jgi:DNA topoisomerase-3
MGKSLIITEKPSVAREFANVLHVSGRQNGYIENQDYVITWCVGHLVGLVYPESYDMKYKKWRLEDLPFLPREYKYDVINDVKSQYDIVHGMLQREDIDRVYWAGDAGKEGQTIEENIRNFGGVRDGMEELRVWIDSQTEEEILRGIREARPMSDYANLGNSGIMRTIEDYAMGINFSRVMSVKYGSLLNDAAGTKSYTAIAVGRVMTCVLGMVVIREREIRNFKETPFYRIVGKFTDAGIEGEWKAVEGSKYFESPLLYKENGFREEKDANALMEELNGKNATVLSIEKNITKKRAPLLFNLAELQAECSKRFKISPDETLQVAQDLYEKKLTTYPRTDARVLSSAIAKEISKNISKLRGYEPTHAFAEEILNKKLYANIIKTQYTDDSKVTDHYAIIPTGQLTELGSLNSLQRAVFDVIVRRFLSIFYPAAEYENVKLVVGVSCGEKTESFFSGAKVLKSPGFLAVATPPKKKAFEEENARILGGQSVSEQEQGDGEQTDEGVAVNPKVLLELAGRLKQGDEVSVQGYGIRYGKTSPPKRYTSGSMVLAMENAGQLIEDEELREQIKGSGIGTSATRAEIIQKLVRIGYLNLNRKTQVLTPENLGEMVYEVVNMTVPALLNPKMTASWEKGLDGITQGTVDFWDYRGKLEDFIRKETLSMIDQNIRQELAERISDFARAGAKGAGARRKIGAKCPACGGEMVTTPFGFGCANYKKDKSGCNFNIGEIAGKSLSEEEAKQLLAEGKTGTLRGFKSKSKKKFDACLLLEKDENGAPQIRFDFANVEAKKVAGVSCPLCGGDIVVTAFGYGCANYKKEDENSCRFSIGKMAEKSLPESQVKRLLTEGRTDTIRGFKSKSGKKFDARVALSKDETGKVTGLKFDFDDVEPVTVKDVVCPLCGGKIAVTPFGYGCTNYKKDDESSCRFMIGKIAGLKLKESQVRELLTLKKTAPIQGFVAKTGMLFEAPLKLTDEGRVEFDFPEKPKPEDSNVPCPNCGKLLKRAQWQYECECGFKLRHTVAQVPLSEEAILELLTTGKTRRKITGFTSKAGNTFDSCLKYENGEIKFDFNNPGEPEEIKQETALSGNTTE